jgi:ribosomal protein S12 methylthiotransferase accessory factor
MNTVGYNNAEYWFATNQPKYGDAVTRSVRPRSTIRRANAVLGRIGVTKVAEVTHLDRIGIPNYMSVRPRDLGPGISYYNGKGTTRLDAHAGALMEAIERQAGEFCEYDVVTGSFEALRVDNRCVDPREIIVPTVRDYSENMILEWVRGFDLLTRQEKLVPLNCVVCPYQPESGTALFYASTNGLASGNTLTEALCHALCEIIERDALAETTARAQLKPAIAKVLSQIGYTTADDARGARPRLIPLRGLPRKAALLVGKMQRSGLQIFLRDMTSTAGIATIDCTIVEAGMDGIPNAHGGCGTHPDARIALTRALTEAAQSRIACIQGGREDLPEIIKPLAPYDPEEVYGGSEFVEFDEIPTYRHDSVDADVRFLLERLRHWGFSEAVAFDLTRPDVGIPVVRVVVPRAEAWTVFHLHTGRGVFGSRITDQICEQ